MTPAPCFEFCIGKGLDIFGLVEGLECRCGASAVNSHDNGLDISHLQFNPATLTLHLNDMTGCPVRAYRYAGHYEGAGFSNTQGHQGFHSPATPQTNKSKLSLSLESVVQERGGRLWTIVPTFWLPLEVVVCRTV